jgi:hypothetical membrane protein
VESFIFSTKRYCHTCPIQETKWREPLFFIADTQFVLCLIIAEALYLGYSVASNYISDLGVGPSALVFNASVFLIGLLLLGGTYLQRHNHNLKTVNILLLLMAVGALGVGILARAKDFTLAHGAVSSAAFFFAGLSAITSSKVLPKPRARCKYGFYEFKIQLPLNA